MDELTKLFLADGWTTERLPTGWLGKGTIHQVGFFTMIKIMVVRMMKITRWVVDHD